MLNIPHKQRWVLGLGFATLPLPIFRQNRR